MPQLRPNFWDALARFESGVESQPGDLVVRQRPQIPARGGRTSFPLRPLEALASGAANPPDAAVPRMAGRAEPKPGGQHESAPPYTFEPNPPGDRNSQPAKGPDDSSYQNYERYRSRFRLSDEEYVPEDAPHATKNHHPTGSRASEDGSYYSDDEISAKRIDLIFDPSQASKDAMVRLELSIEEDWADDLEKFCRLRRLGLIKEAKEHFKSTLEHVFHIPYVRVQYAEMLESSGDYKGFQSLVFLPELSPSWQEETVDDRSRAKLAANHALLDLLSQRPLGSYLVGAWGVVRNTLKALAADTSFGSTEVSCET